MSTKIATKIIRLTIKLLHFYPNPKIFQGQERAAPIKFNANNETADLKICSSD
jgi:hypothetical protein